MWYGTHNMYQYLQKKSQHIFLHILIIIGHNITKKCHEKHDTSVRTDVVGLFCIVLSTGGSQVVSHKIQHLKKKHNYASYV
jgi:hypothetical protein